ncbi:ABC transporter ATP-binding protein [Aeromicrobium sp. PE09-221]|uniref:ABC transporter ATP-binding protein n=1 Tax=Aeromicrobium sp. PE09-221 TaxID=1898043 RepID=UPI0011242798|nr:ABC transporter ATP-binding protein [Aeromicrobium sp. PE09-221]
MLTRITTANVPDEHRRGLRAAEALLVAAAIAQGAGIGALFPVFHALDEARSPWPSLTLLAILWAAWAVLQAAGTALARSHGYGLAGPLLTAIGEQVGSMAPGRLTGPVVGTVSRLAVSDVMSLVTRPAHLLDPAIGAVVTPVAALAVAGFIDPAVSAVGLALLPLILVAYLWCGRRVARSEAALHDAAADVATRIVELAEQQPVLRSAGRADDPDGQVSRALNRLDRRQRQLLREALPGLAGYVVVIQCVIALLVVVLGLAALDGRVGTAGLLTLAVLVVRTGEQLLHAGEHAGASRLAAAAQRRIDDFLEGEGLPEPAVPRHPQLSPSGISVTLDDVTLVRSDGRRALADVSLEIPAGAMAAIVGESGAGKSTIVQLLTRMIDPTSGAVRLAGVDTRDLGTAGVARLVAPVFQHTHLFDDTMVANIAIARPDASPAHIEAAARAAGLDEVAARVPDGWETRVGEGGSLLSSGERQRVAIARAIAKGSPLLVLDEFTSVLDASTESEVVAALRGAVGGATVVIVTHSPAVVSAADVVVTIADGHIVGVERRTPNVSHSPIEGDAHV